MAVAAGKVRNGCIAAIPQTQTQRLYSGVGIFSWHYLRSQFHSQLPGNCVAEGPTFNKRHWHHGRWKSEWVVAFCVSVPFGQGKTLTRGGAVPWCRCLAVPGEGLGWFSPNFEDVGSLWPCGPLRSPRDIPPVLLAPGASCIPRVPSGPSGVSLDPPVCPPVPLVSLGSCSSTVIVWS